MMFARKNKVISINIISKTEKRFNKNHCCSNLYRVICLFLVVIFSLPLYSNEFPAYFRLRPDSTSDTMKWEQSLLSENFSAEQKVGDGEWGKVQGLQRKVKVGVALAGGVVRGIAHIGVLRALEENYIPIDGLSGTSMGSIMGGLYASGYSPDSLELIVKEEIDWKTFFQDQEPRNYTPIWERIRNKPRPPAMEVGLSWKPFFISYKPGTGIRIAQKFTDEIADKTLSACYKAGFNFFELPYPFGAMVVNLNSGQSELKVEGTLSTALRASASIPVAFEPMIIEGEQYIDGGILDNLPVDAFLQEFDKLRNPDNIINIHNKEKGEDIFVIASYPSEIRGAGDKAPEIEEEMSGLVGIGVLNKSSCFAREFHVKNNWIHANGKIDIDVKGGFDFNKEKLEELIDKGHCAAMSRIYDIKKELIRREDGVNPTGQNREIFELDLVKLFHVKSNGTLTVNSKEAKRVKEAAKFIEGSYIEKKDVCYAMRNIYNLGDYKDIEAKVDKKKNKINIELFLTKKDTLSNMIEVKLEMMKGDSTDILINSCVTNKMKGYIAKKDRKLNFSEIEEFVENEYVNWGYVAPSVDSARYSKDTLTVHGDIGKKILGVKIVSSDTSKKISDLGYKQKKDSSNLDPKLEKEFRESLSPGKILEESKKAYKKHHLRTISVEGIKNDSLCIRVRPKTGHTLEFPNLSFDKDQGISQFTELRTKPIRELGKRSFYLNLGQNFPVKVAKELPQGHSYNIGFDRCSPRPLYWSSESFWSLLPDISFGTKRLSYPSLPDTALYDMQYDVYLNVSLSLPIYFFIKDFGCIKDLALIPGVESSWKRYLNDSEQHRPFSGPFTGFLRLEYDDLDRLIFPSSGFKISMGAVHNFNKSSWNTAKIKGTFVKSFRIQNKVKTALTGEFYVSEYQEETPFWKRYSMGGITPIGSYQLRVYDYEDLPGYPRNKFIEPYMFKLGGSARFTLMEMQVLGLGANLYFVSSLYWAGASDPPFSSLFEEDANFFSQKIAFYLDTSLLNVGLGWTNTTGNFLKDIDLSVVLYGIGF